MGAAAPRRITGYPARAGAAPLQFARSWTDNRGARYASASEYLRELIRKQRDIETLCQKLLDGANSGPGKTIDDAWFEELRQRARRRTQE